MIVQMKKISLVMLDSGREKALRSLKKLGVVHLETAAGSSGKLSALEEQRVFLEKCLFSLPDAKKGAMEAPFSSGEEVFKTAEEIDGINTRISRAKEENQLYTKELERLGSLGDFDPRDFKMLAQKGLSLNLYQLTREELESFPKKNSFIVGRSKAFTVVALIQKPDETAPEKMPMDLPELSPGVMAEKIKENSRMIRTWEDELAKMASHAGALKKGMALLDDEIRFEEVHSGVGVDESLVWLMGYCPSSKIENLKTSAARQGWAILVKDPEEGDRPPTLLENNRIVRIIQPVFDILGTIPGYREYDISIWFLMFFTLFFAMIIGDAAYGTIFLAISILVTVKLKRVPDGLKLFYLLSVATILWGAVTGSWFGSEKLANLPFFRQFIFEPVSNFNPLSGDTIKIMCFVIGTVHLSIAHIKNIIKLRRSLKALADLGWLSMVLGLYYLVLNLAIDPKAYPLPPYALYMIAGGFGFLVLFGQQEKGQNFFKGILKGISGLFVTFLNTISAFSDIISYIRLYAVGLATLAISQSFNSMAGGIGGGIGIVFAAVILLLGHGLNLAMAMLSVVVHGVRLNMLEFSGHLGMEWSGIKYEPFRDNNPGAAGSENKNSIREE